MYCPAPATPWLPSLQWLPGEDTRPPAGCKVMRQCFQKIFHYVTWARVWRGGGVLRPRRHHGAARAGVRRHGVRGGGVVLGRGHGDHGGHGEGGDVGDGAAGHGGRHRGEPPAGLGVDVLVAVRDLRAANRDAFRRKHSLLSPPACCGRSPRLRCCTGCIWRGRTPC